MISKQYVILAIVLFVVFYFFFWRPALAVTVPPTMQNDTESIALPTGVNDQGEAEIIYDNPFLVEEWAQGGNDPYEDYLETLLTALTPLEDGSVVIAVGTDTDGTTPETLIESLAADSGFVYTPPTPSPAGTGSTGGAILITASKLRQALAEKGITTLTIKGWDFDDTSFFDDSEFYSRVASFDYSDAAAIAAAVVLRDQNIEEVRIEGTRLTVTYRVKGWLFYLFPLHFTVRLYIDTAGTTDAARVKVEYPWYRLFTWTAVSPIQLAGTLNASIIGIQAAGLNTEEAQARLFTYVSANLRAQDARDVSGLPPAP